MQGIYDSAEKVSDDPIRPGSDDANVWLHRREQKESAM